MAEVKAMGIHGANETKPKTDDPNLKKKPMKRKRAESCAYTESPEEKQAKISEFRSEINSLIKFGRDLGVDLRVPFLENLEKAGFSPASLNGVIACLIEESELPLSKLVDWVLQKIKGANGDDSVSKTSVKSTVLMIGQRLSYGVPNADADILEDESEIALWCWETRDLKLMPKSVRATLKVRRTCRKKIHERIAALLAMVTVLEKSDEYQDCRKELMKASEKLGKVLNEAEIRLLVTMSQQNGAELAEERAKHEEKLLLKQMEKSKKEAEKERKKLDRELQKEKLQSEKELKRIHDEAEKEERRKEKEESDMRKQLRRQQEEAEKDQRRKEKEEAELKRKHALQKQASLMERFLKRENSVSASQHDNPSSEQVASKSSQDKVEKISESIMLAMDPVLSRNDVFDAESIWKSHLNSWNRLGSMIRSNRKMHWGIRRKPKRELVKELKLITNKEQACDEDLSTDKFEDGCPGSNVDNGLSQMDVDSPISNNRKCSQSKQLLQFDKSFRPAFYGVWGKKSQVVGPRHPFAKDPDLDYEIDSDEEWEEEEPGESLSDCDKDEEEDSVERHQRGDDEDESEDGFFVPDGYLSENEGVEADEMESDELTEEKRSLPSSGDTVQNDEFCALLRQQKYLNNLTEHALRKNQPLIIQNLMHEKAPLLSQEELNGQEKLEQMCLQSLSIRPFPFCASVEISLCDDKVDECEEVSPSSTKSCTTPSAAAAAIQNSDLPEIVSVIQSSPYGISKVVESLHHKFPGIPKTQLKNKVREISEFADNRWQVKKDILAELGISISPEKSCGKMKNIATFFSKRCLPPSGMIVNPNEASPQSSQKPSTSVQPSQDSRLENH